MRSQNLLFSGPVPADPEDDHLPGLGLLRELGRALAGWSPGEPEAWRDAGWSLPCKRGTEALEVVLAQGLEPRQWLLQIAPARVPGLVGRLLGRAPSATPAGVQALAVEIHALLAGRFERLRWRWDGVPEDGLSSPEPVAPG